MPKRLAGRVLIPQIHLARLAARDDVADFFAFAKPSGCRHALRRLGPIGDGGYLVPDDLEGVVACISPGVDVESGFALAVAELGMPVYMADASVAGPAISHPNFHFKPQFIDVVETEETTRLDTFVSDNAPASGDLLLQMDIEGAEYRVLLDTSRATLERCRIMVIEFHALDQLFCRFSVRQIKAVFQKLGVTHDIVHIHPNNCRSIKSRFGYAVPPVMEFTFYRRDRNQPPLNAVKGFPHPLDSDNLPKSRSIVLPDCWWR